MPTYSENYEDGFLHNQDLAWVLGISLISFAIAYFTHRKNFSTKRDSLAFKLRDVEARLATTDDCAALYFLHAELVLRSAAPFSALKSLEQAYVLGTPFETLEPTFWACYESITANRDGYLHESNQQWKPGVKTWRRLCEVAPTVMKRVAINISYCESTYQFRSNDATREADKKIREAVYESDGINIVRHGP